MSHTQSEIEAKAEELRQSLKDPNVMHEITKDADIPVDLSTAEMIDAALRGAGFGEQQDEP